MSALSDVLLSVLREHEECGYDKKTGDMRCQCGARTGEWLSRHKADDHRAHLASVLADAIGAELRAWQRTGATQPWKIIEFACDGTPPKLYRLRGLESGEGVTP